MNHLNVLTKLPLVIALSIGLAACNDEDTAKDDVQRGLCSRQPSKPVLKYLVLYPSTCG